MCWLNTFVSASRRRIPVGIGVQQFVLLPIMLYHPLQLLVCAWLARGYATAEARQRTGPKLTAASGRDAGDRQKS
jgi:hypothetical protein